MKTSINTRVSNRIITSIIVLTMVTATGYAQGLLIEGITNLFNSFRNAENNEEFVVITADYKHADAQKNYHNAFQTTVSFGQHIAKEMNEVTLFVDTQINPVVVRRFSVNAIELSYENQLETEPWMTESFSNELETIPEVENWMTESLSVNLEEDVVVEDWMTTSFGQNFEEKLNSESWMTESFYQGIEAEMEVEEWMTEPLISNMDEEELQVEEWMTEPVYSGSDEDELILENWMTKLLI
ncbi:MAG: hypothetical protein WD052_12800 [Bacteroidales bacterium]